MRLLVLLLLLSTASFPELPAQSSAFDLVIRNGHIVVGSSSPWRRGASTFRRPAGSDRTWRPWRGSEDRRLKRLTLEDAIRKFTSLPAQRMRLGDRGVLKVGMWADVVVFGRRATTPAPAPRIP